MKKYIFFFLSLSIILLAACAEAVQTPVVDRKTPMFEYASDVQARKKAEEVAIQFLAAQSGIAPEDIQVVGSEPVIWKNSCLEIPGMENCTAMEIAGFRIMLQSGSQLYEIHSDYEAINIQIAGNTVSSNAALQAVVELLTQQTNVAINEIQIISVEPVDWQDTCLGFENNGICAQVITPGFRIIVNVQGKEIEFHTDISGSQIVSDSSNAEVGKTLLSWRSIENECLYAEFSERAVAFDNCTGDIQVMPYQNTERPAILVTFVTTYAPFSAETSEGVVTLNGIGSMPTQPENELAIASWAKETVDEMIASTNINQANSSEVSEYIGLTMEKRNETTGEFQRLVISRDGKVYASSTNTPQQEAVLDTDQMTLLYLWLETYGSEIFSVPDENEGWQITIQLYGNGSQALSTETQEEMATFSNGLLSDLILGPTKCGNCNVP